MHVIVRIKMSICMNMIHVNVLFRPQHEYASAYFISAARRAALASLVYSRHVERVCVKEGTR